MVSYWEDWEWVNEHMSELQRKHPAMYVAVHKSEVIASGKNYGDVEDESVRRAPRKEVVIRYIESGDLVVW